MYSAARANDLLLSAAGEVPDAGGGSRVALGSCFLIGVSLLVLAVYLFGWPGSRYLPLGLLALALSIALSGMMIAVPIHGRRTRVRIALSLFVVILAVWVINLVVFVTHFLGIALP